MRQVIYPSLKSGVSLGNTWNLVPALLAGFRAWLSAPAILALDSMTDPVTKLVETEHAILPKPVKYSEPARVILLVPIKKLLEPYYCVRIIETPDLSKGFGEVLIVPAPWLEVNHPKPGRNSRCFHQ